MYTGAIDGKVTGIVSPEDGGNSFVGWPIVKWNDTPEGMEDAMVNPANIELKRRGVMSGKVKGTLYKFKEAVEPGDEGLRFEILEDRGDRVLVRETTINDMKGIEPTFVYKMEDLIPVEEPGA
jgi:hypothetical protein